MIMVRRLRHRQTIGAITDMPDLRNAQPVLCSTFTHALRTRALAMVGACTGEYGIGYGKLDFLDAEHGNAVPVMQSIKQSLDPQNLPNRGKVVRYAG